MSWPTTLRTTGPSTRTGSMAFTLIELLVVLAVISSLIAIMLPGLSAARRSAQATRCLANLRRIATASVLYLQRSEGRFAPFRLKEQADGTPYVNEFGRKQPRWQWFLGADLGPVIMPPSDSDAPWGDAVSRTMSHAYFLCPSLAAGPHARDIRNGAYGYNYQYLGNARRDSSPDAYDHFPVSENEIGSPSQTVLVADSRGAEADHGRHSYTLDPPRLAFERNATRFGPGPSDGPISHSPAEARHRGKAAVGFVDGHAEAMSLDELGYEIGPDSVVVPDESRTSPIATNRLWTGTGADRYAEDP
ncbi:MAG: type II secretion system protein [Phycisphaerae bacterium]